MRPNKTQQSLFAAALILASLAGCSGQGNYTRQGVSSAKQRMSFLKSATEWELARQAFLAGDLEKALEKVNVSLEINDTVVKSQVLKGRIELEMGDLGSALESLQTAATLDPQEPDAQYYLGVVYERLNRPNDAYFHFESACEFDNYNPAYAVAASEMLIDLNRVDEAREFLKSLPMSQNNAGIRQSLGHIALIEDEIESAVSYFNEARLLAPDDAGIMEDLIHAQILVGKFGNAESNIAILLKQPENADRRDLKILHAKTLMNTGRPVEARSIYQELLSSAEGKSDVNSWIGLANASFIINDLRTVRKAATRVVSLSPDSHEGYLLYAMYHRESGDFGSSLNAINKSIAHAPNDAGIYAYRAMIFFDLNRQSDAVASIAQAIELDPSNTQYTSMLTEFTSNTFATGQSE